MEVSFFDILINNAKFPYLVVQIEVQIAKNFPEKNNFFRLITIYQRNKITRLKRYGIILQILGAKTLRLQTTEISVVLLIQLSSRSRVQHNQYCTLLSQSDWKYFIY